MALDKENRELTPTELDLIAGGRASAEPDPCSKGCGGANELTAVGGAVAQVFSDAASLLRL